MNSDFTVGYKQGQEHGKQIMLEKLNETLEELRKERDKDYQSEYTHFHGWGIQSAIEIVERHFREELENANSN